MQFSAQPLPSQDANPEEEAKHETAPDHRQEPAFSPPDFSNFQEAHKPKTNLELIRAYGIFTTCQIRPIVQHADTLLDFTKKVLGSTITYGLVRATFFGHFCAGTAIFSPTEFWLSSRVMVYVRVLSDMTKAAPLPLTLFLREVFGSWLQVRVVS